MNLDLEAYRPLYFRRRECLDHIWSTFFSCDACCEGKKKQQTNLKKATKHMTYFFNTLICYRLTSEFMVKVLVCRRTLLLHPCKMTLELISFRPTLEWIFYDSIPLYLSWFVTIKPLENSYQLFTFAQQAHQNWSEWSNDKTPGNTGKTLFDIFVFIIKFLKTKWKH